MQILTICGSSSQSSSNAQLLYHIAKHFDELTFIPSPNLALLPLFQADLDHAPFPNAVLEWRKSVEEASHLLISTPAYLQNIPAILKNALEWLTTSGEMDSKPVLAITYTPHPPRGKEAMESLLWSLKALNARIVAQCPLYQTELSFNSGTLEGAESIELLGEALNLLVGQNIL